MKNRFLLSFIAIAAVFLVFVLSVKETAAADANYFFQSTSDEYEVGDQISIDMFVNSADQAINAAEAEVKYSNDKLGFLSVTNSLSIFSIWPKKPFLDNGLIKFSGGLKNPGYFGSSGFVVRVLFDAIGAGVGFIEVDSGRILANDGIGTNVFGSVEFSVNNKMSISIVEEESESEEEEDVKIEGEEAPVESKPIIDKIIDSIKEFIEEVAREGLVSKIALAIAAALSVASSLSVITTALAAQVGIKELFFVVFNYILSLLSAKRREKSGLIYDQYTNKPIQGAIIRLYEQNVMKLVSSIVSDKKGRYYFTVKPGKYVMSVIKSGYIFPSHAAKKEQSLNEQVYYGQTVEVRGDAGVINYKIPLDPTADAKTTRTMFMVILHSSFVRLSIMVIGTLVSLFALYITPVLVNYLLTSGYLVLWSLEFLMQRRELKFSKVVDKKSKKPIDLALVRIFSKNGKIKNTYVTDFNGKFIPYFQEDGDYMIVERTGYEKIVDRPDRKGFVEGKKYLIDKK